MNDSDEKIVLKKYSVDESLEAARVLSEATVSTPELIKSVSITWNLDRLSKVKEK